MGDYIMLENRIGEILKTKNGKMAKIEKIEVASEATAYWTSPEVKKGELLVIGIIDVGQPGEYRHLWTIQGVSLSSDSENSLIF